MTKQRRKPKPIRTRDLPKLSQKIVKGTKVAKAAVKLGSEALNPLNYAKMASSALRGKGLVVPGTKYLGPGNPLQSGAPTSSTDRLARIHDHEYNDYLSSGISKKRLYLGFSEADQRLMDAADKTTTQGLAAYSGMGAKKILSKITRQKTIKDPKGMKNYNKIF